jgi:hypothetical protein
MENFTFGALLLYLKLPLRSCLEAAVLASGCAEVVKLADTPS